ncbi:hypothetical protein GR01_11700 [Mycobacteroides chelonae]|uniref:hypothetical protein n=1 Tax=Mycobacteroides chelonae TaxID=1774 RepID=UPI000618BD58|nr:hypothetical protein [Mycobacteroides chelonae]AKC39094.1 hypothetical protein GR01_11700 [Mycobacteroides chelonae]
MAPLAVENIAVQRLAQSVGWSKLQTCRRLRVYDGKPTDHQIWFQGNTVENVAALRRTRDAFSGNITNWISGRRAAASWSDLLARGRYELRNCGQRIAADTNNSVAVAVSGTSLGSVEIAVDPGSSTTELIGRPRPDVSEDELTATIADLAGRLISTPSPTRRIVVAVREEDRRLTEALAVHGFRNEGRTLPTLGDASTNRQLWASVRDN